MTDFLSPEDIETLKNKWAGDDTKDTLTKAQFEEFITVVQRRRLDPFTRQIYWTKRWDSMGGFFRMSIEATIDGLRVLAERTNVYAGQVGPVWCGPDGAWKDVWLDKVNPPSAAKVGVMRDGFKEPLYSVAVWDEYVQTTAKGIGAMWAKMGANQLAKCAEALALRKAFPQDTSGLYTKEEMAQDDNAAPEPAKRTRKGAPGGVATSTTASGGETKSPKDETPGSSGETSESGEAGPDEDGVIDTPALDGSAPMTDEQFTAIKALFTKLGVKTVSAVNTKCRQYVEKERPSDEFPWTQLDAEKLMVGLEGESK